MNKQLKTLKRTVVLEGWTNRIGRQTLREIVEAYRAMLQEMLDYTLKYGAASQASLHKVFYHKFRESILGYQQGLSRVVIEMLLEEQNHSEKLKKRGLAKTDKPLVKRVTLTYSDKQD